MPAIPKHVQDLISQGKVHTDQLANLRKETDDLGKSVDGLKQASNDIRREFLQEVTFRSATLQAAIEETRREIAVVKEKLEAQGKKTEEWDRRFWGLLIVLIGALLSLSAGLITALARK